MAGLHCVIDNDTRKVVFSSRVKNDADREAEWRNAKTPGGNRFVVETEQNDAELAKSGRSVAELDSGRLAWLRQDSPLDGPSLRQVLAFAADYDEIARRLQRAIPVDARPLDRKRLGKFANSLFLKSNELEAWFRKAISDSAALVLHQFLKRGLAHFSVILKNSCTDRDVEAALVGLLPSNMIEVIEDRAYSLLADTSSSRIVTGSDRQLAAIVAATIDVLGMAGLHEALSDHCGTRAWMADGIKEAIIEGRLVTRDHMTVKEYIFDICAHAVDYVDSPLLAPGQLTNMLAAASKN